MNELPLLITGDCVDSFNSEVKIVKMNEDILYIILNIIFFYKNIQ